MKNSFTTTNILRQMFTDSSYGMQVIFIFIVMGISYVLFSFMGMVVAAPLFSLSLSEIQLIAEEGLSDASLGFIRFFQVFQTVGVFLVPAIIINRILFSGEGWFSLNTKNASWNSILIIITLLISVPFMQKLIVWNMEIQLPEQWAYFESILQNMELEREVLSKRMLSGSTYSTLLINLLLMAFLPAICEEFLFRGVFQTILVKWLKNAHLGVLFGAVVFSAFHMQFYGFIPRLVLGVYFGYLFFWSKSIWLPVLAHFINNTLAVLLAFAIAKSSSEIPAWFHSTGSWIILSLSIGLTSIAIYFTHRILQRI